MFFRDGGCIMRKQFKTVLLILAATVVFAGCEKEQGNTSDADGTDTLQITETETQTESESTEEVTTVGMEEISGSFSISGTSVVTDNGDNTLKYGNTAGNLINSGIVCESNGKIYYYNKSDNKYLYVMNKDGSDKKALGTIQGAMELNVSGDYIYYQAGGIYRAKLKDGTVETLVESDCGSMIVSNGVIYYIKADGDASKIHSMNVDGSDAKILSDNIASGLNVNEGFIYYINNSDSGKIHKMKLDGSEDQEVTDRRNIQELLVDGSYIYYISSSSDGNHIYRISKSGGEEEKISGDSCSNINVNDGQLFYYNASDDALCYSGPDGSNETVLYNGKLNAVNVIDEWVYFFNTDDFQYYRITKDGNNIEVVE